LLQVLDNGRLTDSKGRVVNFRNSVIIMTSNIGAQHIERMEKLGFTSNQQTSDHDNYEATKAKVTASLKDYFRPEFLNRVDDIIIFDILSPEAIKEIVKIQVEQVAKRLTDKGVTLTLSEDVLGYLAKEGYNPQYGARPLKRLIQNKILTPVAKLLIGQEVGAGGTIVVGVKDGAPAEFSFVVQKGESSRRRRKSGSSVMVGKMIGSN